MLITRLGEPRFCLLPNFAKSIIFTFDKRPRTLSHRHRSNAPKIKIEIDIPQTATYARDIGSV